jgi:hypothetical protein
VVTGNQGDGSDPLCDKKPTGGRCYRHGGTALLFHRIFAKVGANAESTIWENRQLAQTQNQRFRKIASWRKRRINDLGKSPVGARIQTLLKTKNYE